MVERVDGIRRGSQIFPEFCLCIGSSSKRDENRAERITRGREIRLQCQCSAQASFSCPSIPGFDCDDAQIVVRLPRCGIKSNSYVEGSSGAL